MATSLDTGRYTIKNVKWKNLAVLPDPHDESDIEAGTEPKGDGEKWNITLLTNMRYNIKNHGFSNSAGCGTRPEEDDSVSGRRTRDQQWIIKETRKTGWFTISPTDASDLYWGLDDGEIRTPVSLQ
ncbi:hypothetical protein C8R44DRAFT_396243 [Mycena epipterygia]|nr:hypothetical protein C8R44DRAFT_396243 [Mycena epipterygia]